jgi:GNAT superfamily N-acetyltransferase
MIWRGSLGGHEMSYNIEESNAESDIKAVQDGLKGFNDAITGDGNYSPVTLVVRDEQGQVIGGLLAHIYWQWIYVAILWLHEDIRGQGLGSQLLARAEQIGLAKGCHSIHLDTMSFQAPDFYLKHGYTIWGQLDDYPPGHRRIFLKKSLVK